MQVHLPTDVCPASPGYGVTCGYRGGEPFECLLVLSTDTLELLEGFEACLDNRDLPTGARRGRRYASAPGSCFASPPGRPSMYGMKKMRIIPGMVATKVSPK